MSTISAGTTSTTTLIATGDTTGSLVFKTNDTGSGGTTAMTIDTSQNVGVGTTSPGSKLDVKGTLRLSGSSSGYVGLAPAAAAGSTTYTLPSADGTNGQVLSTNGTGTLSWTTAGGVTSVSAGNGIAVTGTTAVTVALDFYTGTTANNTSYPIGSHLHYITGTQYQNNASVTIKANTNWFESVNGSALAGTWRSRGGSQPNYIICVGTYYYYVVQRTA